MHLSKKRLYLPNFLFVADKVLAVFLDTSIFKWLFFQYYCFLVGGIKGINKLIPFGKIIFAQN